ncbi:autotransporter outer membrane beta-barrel domain-containing protein [Pseudomonas moraviensis]|jgi:outer membrane autotransporter protein|uniref:Autotransporter n=1 Tax=Pseudomonas moraviensis R28-S TaxID=1395516 RepID=V8R6G2_9PSED|nr:autotransporter outer membrane beta-barrel domain-containing protein [Pseudomonas moraviensis]ETF07238.1 autotransporter [Pseudomonas moraviensis R28-S]PYC03164.1 autotransporter outer membrane beta-barrel domain-containing protein [Pseudomonas koreensis]
MTFENSLGPTVLKLTGTLSCAALLIAISETAFSRNLNPGEVETVSVGATPEAWFIPATATLNLNGGDALNIVVGGGTLNAISANTAQIEASNALVTLDGARVTGSNFDTALSLTDSSAVVSGSTLSSDGRAMSLTRDLNVPVGSTATVTGSTLTGGFSGAAITSLSTLNLVDSRVEGTDADSVGLELYGGNVNISAASEVIGELDGIIFGEDTVLNPSDVTAQSVLKIDGSTVQGRTGAAIKVDFATPDDQPVLIEIANRSNLISGNGNIVEVIDGAAARFQIDDSQLTGNVAVADGGTAAVFLQNNASLDGNLINVDSVSLDTRSILTGDIQGSGTGVVMLDNDSILHGSVIGVSAMSIGRGAEWNLVGNNSLSNLEMQGGNVRFGTPAEFVRLDVANLSGNGRFFLDADVSTGETDFLNVTESASGRHELVVGASASEPVTGAPVQVANIAGGDAEFDLRNGQVDRGALAYKLVREGEGIFLRTDGTTPSTGTQTALAIAGTAPTVIYSEMTTLNTRLGDRRMAGTQPRSQSIAALDSDNQNATTGLWIRTHANQYNVKNAYGDGYKQNQTGVSLGVDTPLPMGDGQWLIGVFGGYSTTRLDLARGSAGTINSTYGGMYLSWYDEMTGYYVDTVGKINRFSNDVKVTLSDDTRTKGDFDNLGISGTVEVGKHIVLNRGYFIEPSAQFGVATVKGKDYQLDNGLQVDSNETRSLLGKVGMTVGREVVLNNGGKLQPRLHAAVSHEFVNNNRVSVNDTGFNNDLSSTNLELTGGLNWVPANNKWQVYGELGTSRGSKADQELGGSVGLSFSF